MCNVGWMITLGLTDEKTTYSVKQYKLQPKNKFIQIDTLKVTDIRNILLEAVKNMIVRQNRRKGSLLPPGYTVAWKGLCV